MHLHSIELIENVFETPANNVVIESIDGRMHDIRFEYCTNCLPKLAEVAAVVVRIGERNAFQYTRFRDFLWISSLGGETILETDYLHSNLENNVDLYP